MACVGAWPHGCPNEGHAPAIPRTAAGPACAAVHAYAANLRAACQHVRCILLAMADACQARLPHGAHAVAHPLEAPGSCAHLALARGGVAQLLECPWRDGWDVALHCRAAVQERGRGGGCCGGSAADAACGSGHAVCTRQEAPALVFHWNHLFKEVQLVFQERILRAKARGATCMHACDWGAMGRDVCTPAPAMA